MKILNSKSISPFGGLNFVLAELTNLKFNDLLDQNLPLLPAQSVYRWKDIFYGYLSILFCGGDCAEDISINLKSGLKNNPFYNVPSPDRLLDRLKTLAQPVQQVMERKSTVINEFGLNAPLNELNIKLLKRLSLLKRTGNVLDYDNTFLFTDKSDAKYTYYKKKGYCPGVGIIGDKVVYVENRNGNCAPHAQQDKTLERIFKLLQENKISVDCYRADSASYQFEVINMVNQYTKRFYIRSNMRSNAYQAINDIKDWQSIGNGKFRASIGFTPFKEAARKTKQQSLLQEYRLVVTKEPRRDGQSNLFTNEAFEYSAILTNDYEKNDNEVVGFYDQRGKQEREFDVLKNDFAWNKMPFSNLGQNTVFLIITAMCRNIYSYIICKFSKSFKNLKPKYRIKKFIFRFICIPAKWVVSARTHKLRVYGNVHFKT